jgi:sialate O-acetylesterase
MNARPKCSKTLAATALWLCTLLLAAPVVRADVKLSPLFSDHMVLQQGMPVPVWGTADANEAVTVTLGEQKATATADGSGKWTARLAPLTASTKPAELTATGKNASQPARATDVLVGEVWVCSGQSNMEMNVNSSLRAEQERAEAGNYPAVRMFTVKKAIAGKPSATMEGSWAISGPQTVGNFSAVGYFFGRELHKALGVPVGLIHTSWGGTPAESWATDEALRSDPDFKPIVDRWEQMFGQFKQQAAGWRQAVEQWAKAAEEADAAGRPVPPPPQIQDPRSNPWRPSGLYNAMIAPVVPYAIKGATWYQGESNAGRAYQYRKLLPAMIASWRKAWGQGDFPFLIVSLANFMPVQPGPGDSDWAELREAQTLTANQPNNGQSITIDIGDAVDIHPKNKQEVGRRLALVALANTYKKDVPFAGPTYESMTAEGDSIVLKFKNTYGGLAAKGADTLKGFAVAGEDHKWHWADAKIAGADTVVVHSDKVSKPVAVRYAWANNPVCNLYNKADLPAVPFRTDDWNGVTADAK